jgi:probable HAF family extracellular repeat protein
MNRIADPMKPPSAGHPPKPSRVLLPPFLVLWLLFAGGSTGFGYSVVSGLNGTNAPSWTAWNFYTNSGTPTMLLGVTDHNHRWALRLVDNGQPRNNAVVFQPPPTAASRPLRSLDVSFDFSMEDGSGGNGFSFNFTQPPAPPALPGTTGDTGVGNGLSVSFQSDANAPFGKCGRAEVKWQQASMGSVTATANSCFYNSSFPGHWYRVEIKVNGIGAMQLFLSQVAESGQVTRLTTNNFALTGWANFVDSAANRFIFGARTSLNYQMRVYLDNIALGGDSRPEFVSVPSSVTFNEDQANPSFTFSVSDLESSVTATGVVVTGQSIVSSVSVSPITPATTFTVRPVLAPNAFGSNATIRLTITSGALNNSSNVVVLVRSVNDPPQISPVGPVTIGEDTTGMVTFTATDPDNTTLNLMSLSSDNASIIPRANIVLAGATNFNQGSVQTLRFTPATNAVGFCHLTFVVSDPGGLTATQTFTVTVTAGNDPPIFAGLEPSVTLAEDSTLRVDFSVSDVDLPAQTLSVNVVSSSNPSLLPAARISLGGTGNSRFAQLTPLPNMNGSATIILRVSDGLAATTQSFQVQVTPAPDAPTAGAFAGANRALAFDGVDDQVTVSAIGGLSTGNSSHTIEAWIQPGTNVARSWPLLLGPPSAGSEYWLLAPAVDGQTAIQFGVWGGKQVAGPTLNLNTYYHVASVWNAATRVYSVYVDGVLVGESPATGAGDMNPTNTQLTLGRAGVAAPNEQFFVGRLDEVRVWNRALLPDEIRSFRTYPLSGRENGLTLYWRFDEGTGTVATDSGVVSGRSDGLLLGNPAFSGGPPAQRFGRLTVDEDRPATVWLPGFDVETQNGESNANLTYIVSALPTNGVLNRTNGAIYVAAQNPITYTPRTNYAGPDSFQYFVVDSSGLSNGPVIVNLTVAPQNDPPIISTIPSQILEENSTGVVIPFQVQDFETPPDRLTLTVVSGNPRVMPGQNLVLDGSGTNRTLTLRPLEDALGTATITITVADDGDNPLGLASVSFQVRVLPRPAYALVDLGQLPVRRQSSASAINSQSRIVGVAQSQLSDRQAFFHAGLGEGADLVGLGGLGGPISSASALNDDNTIVGFATRPGSTNAEAALWANQAWTGLGFLAGGTISEARGINNPGAVVGFSQITGGAIRAFRWENGIRAALALPANADRTEAGGINDAGSIVGYAGYTNGSERAVEWNGAAVVVRSNLLGPGFVRTRLLALNQAGVMVGYAETSGGARSAFRTTSGAGTNAVDLGLLPGASSATARAINGFNQVVGQSGAAPGSQRAFLHSAVRLHDLNNLIHDARNSDGTEFIFAQSGWVLTDATGINDDGFIVGTGLKDGVSRAYLAAPAWVIGRSIPPPEGAYPRRPEIELVQGQVGDSPENSFIWSPSEQKLYAIRPVTARLKWYTVPEGQDVTGSGTNLVVNSSRIIALGVGVWPKNPTIHIATAPSEVVPPGVPFHYAFQSVAYSSRPGVSVDSSTKRFLDTQRGYAVLHYLLVDPLAPAPDPIAQPYVFDVVKTILWNDALTTQTALIGDVLQFPTHFDYGGRNGYVFFENAYYDGAGLNRAYDRPTRLGPILPVNTRTVSTASESNRLVVIWYHTNRLGVAWSDTSVEYDVQLPTNAARIVIASGLGSGDLFPSLYREPRVYNQPDPSLPGFNPNEEHALLVGERFYALRNDLNGVRKLSDPFALLKYRDPANNEWRIKPYQVLDVGYADDGFYYDFVYTAEAGQEIQPPLPLSVMQLCPDSHGVPGKGPWWEDYKGKIYARAAGPEGGETNIVLRYYYPLQPGFWYDLNGTGTGIPPDGACIPWLNRLHGNVSSDPIDVTYRTIWPTHPPVLEIGSSLLGPRNGLPGVKSMARVQMIYDDLTPTWNYLQEAAPALSLARLYDPISARTVPLPAGWTWPTEIQRVNVNGREVFPQLPSTLKARLTHDPINRWLSFRGVLDETFGAGPNPLLLPNVISPRELQRMKALSGSDQWDQVLTDLYWLTRNPNRVDLDPVDFQSDEDLRLGLTTATNASGQRQVVFESFGDGPKSLTAGWTNVPPAQPRPGKAFQFAGANTTTAPTVPDVIDNFTMEFWAFPTEARASTPQATAGTTGLSGQRYAIFPVDGTLAFGPGHAGVGVSVGFNGVSVFEHADSYLASPLVYDASITGWTHVAVVYETNSVRLFLNGRLVRIATAGPLTAHASLGVGNSIGYYVGTLDELRVWRVARSGSQIRNAMSKRFNGAEDGLAVYWRFDEGSGRQFTDATGSGFDVTLSGALNWVTSTAPAAIPPRFVTLVENNDPNLPGLPVSLHVIQVDDGPYTGDLKVLPGDNVFDERVTVRHSSDFGGAPEQVEFEWYFKPDAPDFDARLLPEVDVDTGAISDLRGWQLYATHGPGINDLTIGEGGESSLLTLGDNWFICRHRGYAVGLRPPTLWSDWVGEPGSFAEPRAQLVEGWIKRVIRGLNPFDARTLDFHASEVNTYVSMLVQAGRRYEGPIAFNPSADNLNSVGLVEAYQTVLERGIGLSIEGAPAVDFEAANNALLLVSSRIADLYLLLGNEAYADAQDPTIGFGTSSGEYGTLAPSIFAFQNQLDSLLEEELVLLRGRDDHSAGVRAAPVYNRAFWNFTLGEGEVAYQQVYNIKDQNFDGIVDERDARILYPQGHGDAWGHYLTAIKTYYRLLRHPQYTWKPRSENVLVSGVAIPVDFLDERKFARAAAAKARAGREIVNLEYRAHYVEDPTGQWQGYKDTDASRAWGVDEWARRAGQGAFFDWLAANAVLPALDANPNHVGIQKIDRTTVAELNEVVAAFLSVQTTMDEADAGLNPLGVAKGALPFDIDPTFLEVGSTAQIGRRAVQGLTQFDQILERAVRALANANTVWDQANKSTELLRRNQDSADAYRRNVRDQESDYKGRLIEIFGYPYAGDTGAGRTYPDGYDGPDLYHYMYVNTTEITGQNSPPSAGFVGYFQAPRAGLEKNDYWFGFDSTTVDTTILPVIYPLSAADYGFTAPPEWGQRRAPGELQMALSDLVQANAQLKIALQNYDGLIQNIEAAISLLEAQYDVNADKIHLLSRNRDSQIGMSSAILALRGLELGLSRVAQVVGDLAQAGIEAIPKEQIFGTANGGDTTSMIRGSMYVVGNVAKSALGVGVDLAQLAQDTFSAAKEGVQLQTDIDLEVADQRYEVLQKVKEIEAMVRDEAALRLEAYNQAEVVQQSAGRYLAKLAEGQRLLEERVRNRRDTAADVTEARYQDMTFRIFRNDALQKYRAAFDLAARYVYLAANAYDFEVNFLGTDQRAGRRFLTDIVRHRNLGQMVDGNPAVGTPGLGDSLARMEANWSVLKGRFGVINPQIADTRFSLRKEAYGIRDDDDAAWRGELKKWRVDDLWTVPEFRRFCRPFAPESLGPQPGLVLHFSTTISFGLNYFGRPLSGGDSAYDPSQFSTKIAKAGIWLSGSDGTQISQTPRVYLVPIGMDVLRSPTGNTLATREWRIVDQVIPVPFPIGQSDLADPDWLPLNDSLGGSFAQVRRYAAMPARHDAGIYAESDLTNDSRLVGRSAWNTEWMLIIPGGTLLNDPNAGLDAFISTVDDIKLYFQTYSYAGD